MIITQSQRQRDQKPRQERETFTRVHSMEAEPYLIVKPFQFKELFRLREVSCVTQTASVPIVNFVPLSVHEHVVLKQFQQSPFFFSFYQGNLFLSSVNCRKQQPSMSIFRTMSMEYLVYKEVIHRKKVYSQANCNNLINFARHLQISCFQSVIPRLRPVHEHFATSKI